MRQIRKVKFIGEMRNLSDEFVPINCSDLPDLISGIKVLFPASPKFFQPHRLMSIGCVRGDSVKWLTRDEALLQIPDCDFLIVGVDFDGSMGPEVVVADLIVKTLTMIAIQWAIGRVITLYLTDKPDPKKEQKDKDSFLLNGPSNSTRAGEAVPLVFGRFRCGSVVISQSLSSERMGTSLRDEWSFTGDGTFTGNFLSNDANNQALTLTSANIDGVDYNLPLTNQSIGFGRTITIGTNGSWSLVVSGVISQTLNEITYLASGATDAGTYTSTSTARIICNPAYDPANEHG